MAWWPEISGAQPNCCGVKKNNALFNRRPSHPQVDVIHQLVVLIFAIIGFCLNAPPTYTQTGMQWKASTSDLGITPDYLNG